MSDQPRADAVRYLDPRAERYVRRFLRQPVQPPQVMLPQGAVAPQSPVRSYAPLMSSGQPTWYIDCANEAATATCSAQAINAGMQWQGEERVEVNGRWYVFERGFWRPPQGVESSRSADSTALLPAIRVPVRAAAQRSKKEV
ncbi:MAG TPA: hypothetical protein VL860_07125 [Planctomycetota bacterium]|nr:hypothetical protein [Planctomycetota bacterium]